MSTVWCLKLKRKEKLCRILEFFCILVSIEKKLGAHIGAAHCLMVSLQAQGGNFIVITTALQAGASLYLDNLTLNLFKRDFFLFRT